LLQVNRTKKTFLSRESLAKEEKEENVAYFQLLKKSRAERNKEMRLSGCVYSIPSLRITLN